MEKAINLVNPKEKKEEKHCIYNIYNDIYYIYNNIIYKYK